jgi:hypothetical protein
MKKLVMLALALVAAAVPLAGCTSTSEIQSALGRTFDVPIHHDAILPAENLRLTFQEVGQDSRCPKNVQCVTAGQAVFTVAFTRGGAAARLTFTELGGGGQTDLHRTGRRRPGHGHFPRLFHQRLAAAVSGAAGRDSPGRLQRPADHLPSPRGRRSPGRRPGGRLRRRDTPPADDGQ